MINWELIRAEFPFFANNPDVIYFDNASTTQKPESVIAEIEKYYRRYCYNVGRGNYQPAAELKIKVDRVREDVAKFINASNGDVHFAGGASTISSDLALLTMPLLNDGDQILVCDDDHKSTIEPWALANRESTAATKLDFFKTSVHGDYDADSIYEKLSAQTRLVVLTQVHNVFGMDMGIEPIIAGIRQRSPMARVIVDATQSVAHGCLDIDRLGADAVYFSGHKMFAGNGIGVLWTSSDFYKELDNYWGDNKGNSHELFEKGTLDIPGILSIGEAVGFIQKIGTDNIKSRLTDLTQYLIKALSAIEKIEFAKGPAVCGCYIGQGILSFTVDGYDVSEIAEVLADNGIYVRADTQCSYRTTRKYLRVSMQIYNTESEIDRFAVRLNSIIMDRY